MAQERFMDYAYPSTKEYMKHLLEWVSPKQAAKYLGVNSAHIYRAKKGDITPTLARAVAAKGYAPPRRRVRWSPDCTPELRDAIRAECDRMGLTNGEILKLMWQGYKNSFVVPLPSNLEADDED
jgi:hypothetical protein